MEFSSDHWRVKTFSLDSLNMGKIKTVKELNVEIELLVEKVKKLEESSKITKDLEKKVENLENRTKLYEEKINSLEKISTIENPEQNVPENVVNNAECKVCGKNFESKKNLMRHVKESHSTTTTDQEKECRICKQTFSKNSELEVHMNKSHSDSTQFKCEVCGKAFVLKWRLDKHKDIHNKEVNIKHCHYYNNEKECPFENIGCMFRHTESKECKYRRSCKIKLCQYKHPENKTERLPCEYCEFEANDKEELRSHKEKDHEYKKYEMMSVENQDEVNEIICSHLCWQGDHNCYELLEDNELLGVNVQKIKDDFFNCVEEEIFQCEYCDYKNSEMKVVRKHFFTKHKKDYRLKCWKCDKKYLTIFDFRKHVGTYHYSVESQKEI